MTATSVIHATPKYTLIQGTRNTHKAFRVHTSGQSSYQSLPKALKHTVTHVRAWLTTLNHGVLLQRCPMVLHLNLRAVKMPQKAEGKA